MKIVVLNGSPRKNGNTSKILKELVRDLEDVQFFDLYSMDISGCSGCMYCKTHDGCSIKDDMAEIYGAIEAADAVIIGSPVYMCEETASTKAAAERLYAFLGNANPGGRPEYVPRLRPGKKGVALFLCGSPLGKRQFRAIARNYERHFRTQGFDEVMSVILPGVHPGMDALQDRRVKRSIARARKLLSR